MNHTSLYTFIVGQRTQDDLEIIGVHLLPAEGTPTYEFHDGHLWKHVGTVNALDDGRIYVIPCAGLSGKEIRNLLAAAEESFLNPPSESTGWSRKTGRHKSWWYSELMLRCEEGSDEAEAIRAFETTSMRNEMNHWATIDRPIDLVPTEKAWEV
ncbi:hypothetical protein I0Q12_00140 [Rhodococcus sp. CX]|uniref:hypothetical protein n=1 Tax=Rhodococcus sp. CX TaxID=2789880 RepID=UPI0018CD8834|nr:hypothetical protein [Rhodococcus sp. CX]MBH0118025.1 hypothetical protein [Rhodococcus sp. CX]